MSPAATAPAISKLNAPALHSANVFDNLVTLCVLAASLAYCAADERPDLAVVTVTASGLGWLMRRGARVRGRVGPNLPGLVVNLLVLGAIIRASWHVLRGQSTGNAVVSDLSEFLIVIQLIKLFDRKNARDDVQLLALTLFVAIGSILTANSLLVGALVFVYTPLITAAAMALQVDVGLRRLAGAAGIGGVGASRVSVGGADGPGRARHFRGTVAVAVVGSLVFASLAFVLLPRGLGRNTLGAFGRIQQGSQVGFTNTIRLGQPGFLKPDDATPVMDVAVWDRDGTANIGAQLRTLLLRGNVSNKYDPETGQWDSQVFAGERVGESWDQYEDSWGLDKREMGTGAYQQVVTLRGSGGTGGYLFSIWRPRRLDWDTSAPVTVYRNSVVFARGARGSGSGQFRYTVWSEIEASGGEGAAWVPPTFQPGGDPRVAWIRGEAERVLGARGISVEPGERSRDENRAAASAFQGYLRETATYTLEMMALPVGQDPIEFFLRERHQGHCEYFASALVALCQSVGLPARLAMGYLATEYNNVTGQFVVRASNAHAWAEVQIEPGRWATFDPSPPAVIEQIHAPGTGVFARIKRAYEAIDFAWNSLVVSFDEQRRSSILGSGGDLSALRERLGSIGRSIDERVKQLAGEFTGGPVKSRVWTYVVVGCIALAAGSLAFWRPVTRLFKRLVRPERGLGGTDPLAVDLHQRLLRTLRQARVPKPEPAPLLTYARSLGTDNPVLGAAAVEAAEAVYGSRFAGSALTRERWRTLARALEEAESSAGVGVGAGAGNGTVGPASGKSG